MSKLCIDLPPIAPDYSGAASALFDLGGIVVMHDASGCTGNYTGFDEPRWLGSRSAVYCSGLRRMDCIMGNDQKFIDGTLEAAKSLNPTMISYLGSPVPMVIGIDLEGMAMETEQTSGIPSFGFNTTGQHYYDKGASDVFVKLIKRFAKKPESIHLAAGETARQKRANVLGLLSVDMGNEQNTEDICRCIEEAGFEINSRFAMGLNIDQIERVAEADLNIVISRCGLETAIYMEKNFGIPYICGAPVGDGRVFKHKLKNFLLVSGSGIAEGEFKQESSLSSDQERGILIIHEQILSNSIREILSEKADCPVTVGSMYHLERCLAMEHDLDLPNELSVRKAINSGNYSVVIADPQIKRLLKRDDVTFIEMPHVALSGRLHLDTYPSYLGEDMSERIARALNFIRKE